MTTFEHTTVPAELLTELRDAVSRASEGIRDRAVMDRACRDMDRTRAEILARHGILDIAVPAIRELRDA